MNPNPNPTILTSHLEALELAGGGVPTLIPTLSITLTLATLKRLSLSLTLLYSLATLKRLSLPAGVFSPD